MISSPVRMSTDPSPTMTRLAEREVLADRLAEALDRAPGLAQVDPAVEELLDHLQLEQVPVGIKPLGPAARAFASDGRLRPVRSQ